MSEVLHRVLLVFQNVPEDVFIYALELNDADYLRLVKCRLQFGNSVELTKQPADVQEAVDWLGDRVFNDPSWEPRKLDLATAYHVGEGAEIVVSGWFM